MKNISHIPTSSYTKSMVNSSPWKLMVQTSCKRLLIVDNSPDFQTLLTLFFESKGYEVTAVANGQEALDLFGSMTEQASENPDLILLDLMMPEMDGFEFLERKKKNPKVEKTPVILMSAGVVDQEKVSKAPISDFLTKPFELGELQEAVEKCIKN